MSSRRIELQLKSLLAYAAFTLFVSFLAALPASGKEPGADPYRCFVEGLDRSAECREIAVPLNHAEPDGETITLHLALVSAKGGVAKPDPLLVLAGGPGQAATDYGPYIETAFAKINESRDIVLVDQRGTGDSNPLSCPFLEEAGYEYPSERELAEFGRRCAASHQVDVRYFTSFDAIADLEVVRKELSIERFNLWGGSYGTRLALLYMRLHPESIRTAILDGATPPTQSLFVLAPETAQAALDRLIADCASDPECGAAFPALGEEIRALLEDFAGAKTLTVPAPYEGDFAEMEISRRWIAEAIRAALYVPSRSAVVPYAVARAREGDFRPFMGLGLDTASWAAETMAIGLSLSVLCSEDVPRITDREAAAAGEGSYHQDAYYRYWKAACTHWPTRDVTEGYGAPVTADVPTLILSGALDPVTPPATGEMAATHLPDVLHLSAENAGHNVSGFGCAPRLMGRFVEQGTLEGIDGDCLDEPVRPPFLLTATGYTLANGSEGENR